MTQSHRENKQKKNQIIKKRRVSMNTDPSQGPKGAAEIRKPGVRFPVEMRICFGVRMELRWFD